MIWEQRKLDDFSKISTGKAFLSSEYSTQGKFRVITNKNINKANKKVDHITPSENEDVQKYILHGENILVTMDGVKIGNIAYFSDDKALLAQRVGRIQSTKNSDFYYLFSILINKDFKNVMKKKAVGNAIKHISLKDIKKYTRYFSENKVEQQKIGRLFYLLENLITLQQRKKKDLEFTKMALCQHIFSKSGSPNIYFGHLICKWKKQSLKNKVSFYNGLTYHPQDIRDVGTLVIRSSNIQNHQLNKKDTVFVSPNIVNTPNVKQGDIVVVVRNGSRNLIGKHVLIHEKWPNTVIGAFMTGIRSESNQYINALLDSDLFKKKVFENLGATINQITIHDFKEMKFYFPIDEKEENRIGELFTKIDQLINIQTQRIAKLNSIKHFLLQSLFI